MKVDRAATRLGYCCLYQAIHHSRQMPEAEVAAALGCNARYIRQLRRSVREGQITCSQSLDCKKEKPSEQEEENSSVGTAGDGAGRVA